ncbi:MAG: trigger factor [Tannerella sp.]|nr:trigger factor [Tannerella sp.]
MNILIENRDAVRGTVKLEVEKKDYEGRVEKSLRQYRRSAQLPGFRKGMIPMSLIEKKYGKAVLFEEVSEVVSEALSRYLREENLQTLGNPLPDYERNNENDFDEPSDYTLYFFIALKPEIKIRPTKRDKLTYYDIIIDDPMVDKQMDSYRQSFGEYVTADAAEATDMVKGLVTELDGDAPKEGGLRVENAVLMPSYIKKKREQNKFVGAKNGDTIRFNPQKTFEGNAAEIASFLKTDKEAAAGIESDFLFTVEEITRYQPAEINQALFDKVMGEGAVKDETEFREAVKEKVADSLRQYSDTVFQKDVRKWLLGKMKDVALADDLIKRMMLENKQLTKENIDEQYPREEENLKYYLAKRSLIETLQPEVSDEEIRDRMAQLLKMRYASYGIYSLPDSVVTEQVEEMFRKEEDRENIRLQIEDDKLYDWLKDKVTVDKKEVSYDEFEKIITENAPD